MMRGEGQRRPHALVLPCAAQGHINPLMQLAQHLVACHGFQITFVNTHDYHARILQHSFGLQLTQPQPQPLANACTSRRCPSYPDIELVGLSAPAPPPPSQLSPQSLEHNPPLDNFLLLPFIPLIEHLICDINLSSNPLTCIIADAFLYWLPPIARTAHIPSLIAVFPSSAANLLLLCYIPSLLSSGVINPDGTLGGCEKLLIGLEGLPSIQSKDASWIAGFPSDGINAMFNMASSVSKHLKEFDAILLNTYQELENEALDGLAKLNLQVAPIGPLILLETQNITYNVACSSLWTKDNDCLQWLEGRPNISVIYISFGSLATFNVRDLRELALGIEASQLDFVWVLGPCWIDKKDELFCEGFLERTKDRALFIPWAPQSLVLAHPSIGVFVTHCGWNSTIEAISIGVPMLTWPCFGDQALICQYITQEWKIGMPINKHNHEMHREEIKRIVLSIMVGMKGIEMREKMTKFKEEAKFALEKKFGKSFQKLQNVVQHMVGF